MTYSVAADSDTILANKPESEGAMTPMRLICTITPTIHGDYSVLLETADLWTDEPVSTWGRAALQYSELAEWLEKELWEYHKVQDLSRRAGLP